MPAQRAADEVLHERHKIGTLRFQGERKPASSIRNKYGIVQWQTIHVVCRLAHKTVKPFKYQALVPTCQAP